MNRVAKIESCGTFAGTIKRADHVIRTLDAISADLVAVQWTSNRDEWDRVIGQLDVAMSRIGELSGLCVLAQTAARSYRALNWEGGRRA